MKGLRLVLLWAAFGAGCTAMSLQRNTLQQIASITDLRYQEVMNNLAIVAANPDALPSLSIVADGNATIADTVTFDAKTLWQRMTFKGFDSETLTPGVARSPQPLWSLEPMVDYEKLAGSWYALRWALGYPSESGSPGYDWLKYFQIDKSLAQLPSGWLHVGGCRDVPVKAAYKSHCGGTWVWVNPDGMAGLSALTLVILDIGTVNLNSLGDLHPDYQGPNAKVKVVITRNIAAKVGSVPQLKQSIQQDKQVARQIDGDASKTIWVNLKCWPSGVAPPVYLQFSPFDLNQPMPVATAPPFPEGAALEGAALEGAAPGGAAPGRAMPGGAAPGGAAPGGAAPGRAMPGGAAPSPPSPRKSMQFNR